MKVIGLSGAQGGGKSSLLIELENRGWQLDKFRVSRAVQAQLGWDRLDTVMESWETMTRFQEEVFAQKYEHDFALSEQKADEIVLTERTFADIAAYTALWTWKHVDRGSVSFETAVAWLNKYVGRCVEAQKMYTAIMLLPYMPEVVAWEDDKNRAARADVNAVYEDVERFIQKPVFLTMKKLTINTKSVPERADQVEAFLRTL